MEMEFSHEKIFGFADDAYDDRARFLAEFTLRGQSKILLPRLRDQDDSEGLGMTGSEG
jgi:hypothetical protein